MVESKSQIPRVTIARDTSTSNELLSPDQSSKPASRKFVLFPLSHVVAHVSRTLELAKVLRARGHEVVFAASDTSHPRSKMKLVQAEGFRVAEAAEPDHAYMWTRLMTRGSWVGAYDLTHLKAWLQIDTIVDSQVRVILEEQPDVVVGAGSVGLSSAAHIARVPAALLTNAYLFDFVLSNAIRLAMWRGYHRVYYASARNRVYRKYGVKPVDATALFLSVPILAPELPGLWNTCNALRKVSNLGPIDFEFSAPLPAWYDRLDDGKTNVYITMGSTGLGDAFLQRAYRVLHASPYRFVVTTGGQASASTVQNAPPNFLITDFAPGTALLKKCKAMIFQGGNCSMYQALRVGVPMIAVPMQMEQMINAHIAKRNGFSLILRMGEVGSSAMVRAMSTVVEESSFRDAAEALSKRLVGVNGAIPIADRLEHIAATAEPAGSSLSAI